MGDLSLCLRKGARSASWLVFSVRTERAGHDSRHVTRYAVALVRNPSGRRPLLDEPIVSEIVLDASSVTP